MQPGQRSQTLKTIAPDLVQLIPFQPQADQFRHVFECSIGKVLKAVVLKVEEGQVLQVGKDVGIVDAFQLVAIEVQMEEVGEVLEGSHWEVGDLVVAQVEELEFFAVGKGAGGNFGDAVVVQLENC